MLAERTVELVRQAIDDLRARADAERADALEAVLQVALSHQAVNDRAEDYLTPAQAARAIGVSAATVRGWITAGRLPARQDGKRFLVHRQTLAEFLESLGRDEPQRRAPWEDVTPEQAALFARIAEEAPPPDKLARLRALHDRMEEGERLTRAERREMVTLEREVNAAASARLAEIISARQA